MEASTRNRSSSQGTTLQRQFQRSLSPSPRFCSSSISTSPSSSTFSTRSVNRSAPILNRSTSPTRVSLGKSASPSSSSIRLSAAASLRNSIAFPGNRSLNPGPKKTCLCSPTTHPGSFRCSFHKKNSNSQKTRTSYRPNHQLNMRRSAMTNSLVRIGTVEGELLKRALAALIRPSSHSLRRRDDFVPKPSRLSVMSKADGV